VGATENPESANAELARVFVIHGRDLEAVAQLESFLKRLGLKHVRFEDVADGLRSNAFIADIVVEGIRNAQIVIGLFTPDEVAALYDHGGEYVEASARWQARPNVLFEAGVAWGIGREKVILATLGADVELFSDVDGIHILRLDQEKGRRSMITNIENILGRKLDTNEGYEEANFSQVTRKRWEYYDELDDLQRELRDQQVGSGRLSVFDVLARAVRELGGVNFMRLSTAQLMAGIQKRYSPQITNETYWWLIVLGVFRFKDIGGNWFDDNGVNWKFSVQYSEISNRGRALLRKLAAG